MTQKTLLVVDDEAAMRRNVLDILSRPGLRILEAEDGAQAFDTLRNEEVDVLLLDVRLPDVDGIEALKKIKGIYPDMPVVLFTAFSTSERIMEAMGRGAYDYLEKPFDAEDIEIIISRALEHADLLSEIRELRSKVEGSVAKIIDDSPIIGQAPCMQDIFKQIGIISSSDAPVLIEGESGSGKEVIADAVHRHSLRAEKPFIKVNCAAYSESLLESEIFGHEKGAFTGASTQRQGHFEMADGGTLLLDEISGMSKRLQARLLRVLQQGTFFRVGGKELVRVNVRLISLSNRNLEEEVKAGRFRYDLFYRINVIRIDLPPLRERLEDVPLLVNHFVNKYSPERDFIIPDDIMKRLMTYSWPGNVRELENIVRRGLALSSGDILKIDCQPVERYSLSLGGDYRDDLSKGRTLKDILADLEKRIIREILAEQGGNRSRAAKILGVHRRYLYSKMKQYDIH